MKTIKTILAFLMVISMVAPAMAGVDVGAYRERFSTGFDSVIASARDGNLRGTVATSIGLDTGTTGIAWAAANVGAYSDGAGIYSESWSYSNIIAGSFLDTVGTDSLSASSAGTAVVTDDFVPIVQTTSNGILSMSLTVGADSLQARTYGDVYADAWSDTNSGTWTDNYVYGDVYAGDGNTVYAIAWGYSEDPVFASISLDANVNVNGETASATLDGSATSSAVVVP